MIHGGRQGAEPLSRAPVGVERLLADDRIDAVFVLSTAERHVDHAIRAPGGGKHVFVEKTVGETVAEIERLQVAARSGRVCMRSHNYIDAPDVRRLRHPLRAVASVGSTASGCRATSVGRGPWANPASC